VAASVGAAALAVVADGLAVVASAAAVVGGRNRSEVPNRKMQIVEDRYVGND
jgi:hypothetical protein